MLDRRDLPILILLCILAVVVSSINFARVYEDSIYYFSLVDWFQGDGELIPPFCYRPVIPFLASILPIDPVISMSMLSMGFLVVLTIMIYSLCILIGASRFPALIATALATVSQPVLEYGAVVLLDSSYIFFMSLAIFFMLHPKTRVKWYLILAVIVVGVFFKESAATASVAYILYTRKWRQVPIFVIGPGLGYLSCRLIVGVLHIEGAQDIWIPRLSHLLDMTPAIMRYLGLGLVTFSWLLILIPIVRIPKEHLSWILSIGCAMGILMIYAMTAASFDGRFVWPMFLMLAPLAALVIDRTIMIIRNKRETTDDEDIKAIDKSIE